MVGGVGVGEGYCGGRRWVWCVMGSIGFGAGAGAGEGEVWCDVFSAWTESLMHDCGVGLLIYGVGFRERSLGTFKCGHGVNTRRSSLCVEHSMHRY